MVGSREASARLLERETSAHAQERSPGEFNASHATSRYDSRWISFPPLDLNESGDRTASRVSPGLPPVIQNRDRGCIVARTRQQRHKQPLAKPDERGHFNTAD